MRASTITASSVSRFVNDQFGEAHPFTVREGTHIEILFDSVNMRAIHFVHVLSRALSNNGYIHTVRIDLGRVLVTGKSA